MYADHEYDNENQEEDQQGKVDAGHHLVPVGHLHLYRGGDGEGGLGGLTGWRKEGKTAREGL